MSASQHPSGPGRDPDEVLRRGLAGLGSEAGLPDSDSLRTAVVARARRDRAIQRLATSTAVLLPVAVLVWSVGGLDRQNFVDLANLGSAPKADVITSSSSSSSPAATPTTSPTQTAPALPSGSPVPTPRPSASASVPAPTPTSIPTPSARPSVPVVVVNSPSVDLVIDDVTPSAAGWLIHYVITWTGSDAPMTSVVLQEGKSSGARVLKSWQGSPTCPADAGRQLTRSVSGQAEVPARQTIVLIARVHTQACGGPDRQGATAVSWNTRTEAPPSSTPIPVPSSSPSAEPTVTPQPTVTPSAPAASGETPTPTPTASAVPPAGSRAAPLSNAANGAASAGPAGQPAT